MSDTDKTMVVALGGNAISDPSEEGNINQQFERSRHTARVLCDAVQRGYRLIITHGNGPQVGNVLRRAEIASGELYMIPLEICVADTQAGMGYMIGQCITNELMARGIEKQITTVVTSVLVDRDDPAFANPTKPIGSRVSEAQAEQHRAEDGWTMVQVDDDLYRRVVASPPPVEILELPVIRRLIDAGDLVIACGGGGIPVILNDERHYRGAAAVIDKDRTSALLARELDADILVILTSVDRVYINFGKPDERGLDCLTVGEAKDLLDAGQFPEGSMGPKIQSAIDFVTQSSKADAAVIIAQLDKLTEALDGTSGTRITRG
ncbi:MAG: carbamate kinase [Phycisphaerales bacterium]|nr:carbamate kinase [Phycisphaerales bacterium]